MGQSSQKKCLLLHVPKLTDFKPDEKWNTFVNDIAMGVFSLSHQLEINGFEHEIIHMTIEKYYDSKFSIAKYVKESGIKFVGISLHWHFQAFDTIEVAKAIKKENPDAFIVLGGYTASCYAEEIVETYSFIDAVIKGEGEASIVPLAMKVMTDDSNLESIPNLYWRKNGECVVNTEAYAASSEDLDTFSFYSQLKRLKNNQLYFTLNAKVGFTINDGVSVINRVPPDKQIHTICLGRGCGGNCTWCGGGQRALKKIIHRDCISWRNPGLVADEILMLKKDYDINGFYFCFDPTPSEQNKIISLFRMLGDSGEKVKIFFECFGLPSSDFISEFKTNLSADSTIAISPEFGDEKLRAAHKSFSYTNNELENVLDKLASLKINSLLYFTHIPILTAADEQVTIDYSNSLITRYYPYVKALVIPISFFEPAAPWTEEPEKYGAHFTKKTFADFYNEHSVPNTSWESPEFVNF